ncbi:MAG: hypothetical protein STSR0007_09810 [Thermovirga sp.]
MTVAYFDGASRGNPGESAAGACIIDDDGTTAWEDCRALGRGTNNEAEYHALIMLLEEISKRGLKNVTVRGDSRLVVSQVKGEWKVREERLRILADRARSLVRISGATLEWVPREQNILADALSNKALDKGKNTKVAPFPKERLEPVSGGIFVAHGSSDYAVDVPHLSCSCPSFRSRGKCKHLDAAVSLMETEKKNCSSS